MKTIEFVIELLIILACLALPAWNAYNIYKSDKGGDSKAIFPACAIVAISLILAGYLTDLFHVWFILQLK